MCLSYSIKLESLLLVCFVRLLAVPVFAQSGAAAGDLISGVWTGHMGPGATPQFAITIEMPNE